MKYPITITIDADPSVLNGYTDGYLATLWSVAQANPAPVEQVWAGEVVEAVGREIIRRFLLRTGPELWNHDGGRATWDFARRHGKFVEGVWVLDPNKFKEGE